jgi:hypothetical protein
MGSDVAIRALEVGSSGLGPALNYRLVFSINIIPWNLISISASFLIGCSSY